MHHPDFIVCNFMVNSIGLKRVKIDTFPASHKLSAIMESEALVNDNGQVDFTTLGQLDRLIDCKLFEVQSPTIVQNRKRYCNFVKMKKKNMDIIGTMTFN